MISLHESRHTGAPGAMLNTREVTGTPRAYRNLWRLGICAIMNILCLWSQGACANSVYNGSLDDALLKQTTLQADGSRTGHVTLKLSDAGFKSTQLGGERSYAFGRDNLWTELNDEALSGGMSSKTRYHGSCTITMEAYSQLDSKTPLPTKKNKFDINVGASNFQLLGHVSDLLVNAGMVYFPGIMRTNAHSNMGDAGRNSLTCTGGSLEFDANIPKGATVTWNNVALRIMTQTEYAYDMMSMGLFTESSMTPPTPPAKIGRAPVCSWGTAPATTQLDFGTVQNTIMKDWQIIKELNAINISASCVSTGESLAAVVSVSGFTPNSLDGQGNVVKFQSTAKTENGLLLSLAVPSTAPKGITYAKNYQVNDLLLFNSDSTPRPWWSWSVDASSSKGTTNLPPLAIKPQLRTRSPAVWTADMYDKELNATVVLRMATK